MLGSVLCGVCSVLVCVCVCMCECVCCVCVVCVCVCVYTCIYNSLPLSLSIYMLGTKYGFSMDFEYTYISFLNIYNLFI